MDLDRRKQLLLHTIVVNYVQRAEPVGSHFLASQEGLGVRSATIRNELAEMTELGYLRQPHTSAGESRAPISQNRWTTCPLSSTTTASKRRGATCTRCTWWMPGSSAVGGLATEV